MCECCGNNAMNSISHLHVQAVADQEALQAIKKQLANVPGVVNVEYKVESQEAKVNFDTRLVDRDRLEKILKLA